MPEQTEHRDTQTAQTSGTVQLNQQEDEAPEQKSGRKFIVIAVIILLVIGAGIFYWRSTFTEDTDDAQVDGDLYQVSSRVTGQVIKVYVEDNQKVDVGQIIAEIDPKDYQVALEQAQANLASAQAADIQAEVTVPITSVNVNTSVDTTSSDVLNSTAAVDQARKQEQAAEARVVAAKANALKSHLDVERYTPLVQKDVISKQQYDAAVATDASNQAAVLEAEANVIAAQAQVTESLQRLSQSRYQAAQSIKNWPRPGKGAAGKGKRYARRCQTGPGQGRSGSPEPRLHPHHRSHHRHRQQEERPGGREPQHRPGPPDHHPADQPLGNRKLQGDPALRDAPRPAGHVEGRRSRRP